MPTKVKNFIGIDIGGTNIRGVLWNGKKILRKREIKTPQSRLAFEKELKRLVKNLTQSNKIDGIGIGSAGVVEGTILLFSPNIPKVKNFDFRKIAPHRAWLSVDNDARTFARGEYFLGRGFKRAFFLTIGTGVGRAAGRNGEILKIKKFEYPESWEREYQKMRDKKNDQELADFLGRHLSKLIKPYKPEAIVIGGGVVIDRKGFIQKLKKSFNKEGFNWSILKSRLGAYAAPIGAALLNVEV